MTVSDRTLAVATLAVLLVGAVFGMGAFLVTAGAVTPEPVSFDDTIQLGVGISAEQTAQQRGLTIPRAQVFYSQFEYVLGYNGVGQAVGALERPGREGQFGYPLVVYVSDYATVAPTCENGTLRANAGVDWEPAGEAAFVVGSEARTPAGDAVVPFGSVAAAESFVADCGGHIVDWATLRDRSFDLDRAGDVRERVGPQHAWATEAVAASRALLDREVAVVVGADAPTVQSALDLAPRNATVLVPPGTYEERLRIAKPVTLRGQNATLRGSGNGTVVEVRADDVAITGFHIEGVGNATQKPGTDLGAPAEEWDARFERAYGHGDAGVGVANVTGTYVGNVTIETPANGVVFRDAPGGVIEDLRVDGMDDWQAGFMGVASVRSRLVVQDSTFVGGRDGVYLHRGDGTVIRNSTFRAQRYGVHTMFTSRTLIANNVAREEAFAGIVIMTDPTANAVVGNDVRDSTTGIATAGSRSYLAYNVVVDTNRGLSTAAEQSLYEHNVLYENQIGLVASTIVPSNWVVANDLVANDRHAISGVGALRVFTREGRGNYWEGAYGVAGPDGTLDRAYVPTSPIDRRLHRTRAAVTLGSAPAVRGVRALRGTVPGLRSGSIVDLAPLSEPANPVLLASARNGTPIQGRVSDP